MSLYDLICMEVSWHEEEKEFDIDKGWIAGAFFLGLIIGGTITALIVPPCYRDWEKKKRQDEEDLINNEEMPADSTPSKGKGYYGDEELGDAGGKGGKFAMATAVLPMKKKRKGSAKSTSTQDQDGKGWVQSDQGNKQSGGVSVGTDAVGIVEILTKPNSGEADSALTQQDIDDMEKLDSSQKQDKNDMLLKMLKMKLRKMKGKGQIGDPYLADFTQKVIDNRKGNQEMINMERKEAEEEIKLKHKKNRPQMDSEIDNLNIRLDAKQRQLEKDELEHIRGELLRTSGLTEAEVDDLMEKLKQDMAELERRQGLEQARQARHLAERLEKRRQMLEFRKFQEQQGRQEGGAEVKAFEEPLQKLVDDGKLMEKQKKELLDEHQRNLASLQKSHGLDAMRQQQDLTEKLRQRRAARLIKLQDKQEREKAALMQKSEKATNTTEFINAYQDLVQQQQHETEAVETEMDQTEIQELERLTQTLDDQKELAMKDTADKMVQSATTMGQLSDMDVKRIIKLHNLQMDAYDARRRDELENMRTKLQNRWQQRLKKMERDEKLGEEERAAILEQQDITVKKVLGSNLDLTEEAKDKILKEHERNLAALNNQLARSKTKQQASLEHKLAARKARLAAIRAEQQALESEKKAASEKEIQKLQARLDEEMLLFEKEKKQAENDLRRRLALETEAALQQQERELAALIGRLEVGHARRMAVLQKQDKQLKELQRKNERGKEQLEGKLESGGISSNKADQIIQQHYNQVEHVNNVMQQTRERQEQAIQEKLQAKRFQKTRDIEDQLRQEQEELQLARRQAGTGTASAILNAALMKQRHKKAMEDLESEMQVELERNREQLNEELQQSLEKELESHKNQFLSQLAAASKVSPEEIQANRGYSRNSRPGSGRAQFDQYSGKGSTLGTMEEDSDDEDFGAQRTVIRPKSSSLRARSAQGQRDYNTSRRLSDDNSRRFADDTFSTSTSRNVSTPPPQRKDFVKKRHTFGPQPPRNQFKTSTGEQVHGIWDLDDGTL